MPPLMKNVGVDLGVDDPQISADQSGSPHRAVPSFVLTTQCGLGSITSWIVIATATSGIAGQTTPRKSHTRNRRLSDPLGWSETKSTKSNGQSEAMGWRTPRP